MASATREDLIRTDYHDCSEVVNAPGSIFPSAFTPNGKTPSQAREILAQSLGYAARSEVIGVILDHLRAGIRVEAWDREGHRWTWTPRTREEAEAGHLGRPLYSVRLTQAGNTYTRWDYTELGPVPADTYRICDRPEGL